MGNYANGSVSNSYGMIYTINNKFNFRSPDLRSDNYAYIVGTDGFVSSGYFLDVSDSCGQCSPGSSYGFYSYAYYVGSGGDVDNDGSIITDSYGIQ